MNAGGSKGQIVLCLLLTALILAVAELLVITLTVLLLIFAGVLFGIFLNGISSWIADYLPLSYVWANALVVTVLIVLVCLGVYYLGSQIAEQATELQSQLEQSAQNLSEKLRESDWAQQFFNQDSNLSNIFSGKTMQNLMRGMQQVAWLITGLLVIFFVGLYLAFDPALYEEGFLQIVPPRRREFAKEIMRRCRTVLGYWIVGRLVSMSIISLITMIGLWLLDVPLAISLGVLAGLLTFIPNIGPVIAAVPQALLALQVGINTVLYVILFNLALQGVESYLVTPMIQRYEVSLPPALTIFAQLLMGLLVGVIGIVMAAPMTAAIIVLVNILYLGNDATPAPEKT